jgi:hypothetical protein
MTHTKLRGRYCLRLSIGQTETRREHVREAQEALLAALAGLSDASGDGQPQGEPGH